MKIEFNGKALWGLAAILVLVAVATEQATFGIALVIGATVIVELLTWAGVFGFGKSYCR